MASRTTLSLTTRFIVLFSFVQTCFARKLIHGGIIDRSEHAARLLQAYATIEPFAGAVPAASYDNPQRAVARYLFKARATFVIAAYASRILNGALPVNPVGSATTFVNPSSDTGTPLILSRGIKRRFAPVYLASLDPLQANGQKVAP
jgi:hypothetical protein